MKFNLSVALTLPAAFILSAGFTRKDATSNQERIRLNPPKFVSCLLTMSKVDTNDPNLIGQLSYSCNDFSIQSQDEYDFVAVGCQLAATLQRFAFKVEAKTCQSARAYAHCKVVINSETGESIDTHYFVGKKSRNNPQDEEILFRENCDKLGGEFIK